MYGENILCGISKGTFEIPRKISSPYIERYDFYKMMQFQEILDWWIHTPPSTHWGTGPLLLTWFNLE